MFRGSYRRAARRGGIETERRPFAGDSAQAPAYSGGIRFLEVAFVALNPEIKYPSRRTYVLKVRNDAAPGALAGRLENVVTGRQRDFASERELVDSLASDLREGAAPRPAGDAG